MVYRGKPSLGCHSCRTRRIKCDQLRPGCTQCANIGTECPGYRNPLDLMFRDESLAIRRKAHSKAKKGKNGKSLRMASIDIAEEGRGSETSSSGDSPGSLSYNTVVPFSSEPSWDGTPPLTAPPSFHVTDLATSFFMRTYIYGSRFDYLPLLYEAPMDKESPLDYCVKASALASLSQELESWEIAAVGRKYYAQALRLTNAALATRTKAVRNETLASVLMLSLFETITQADEMSRSSWLAHINGAAALLKLRGQEQFTTKLGRLLFLHAADSIRIRCFQHQVTIPEHLLSFDHSALARIDGIVLDLSVLINRMAQLRAVTKEMATKDPYRLIEMIYEYQKELPVIKAHLPVDVQYQVCRTTTAEPNVFGDTYHIYKSHRNLRLWNTLRMIQIWISEVLSWLTTYVPSQEHPRPSGFILDIESIHRISIERMLVVADEICASVPQVMGDVKLPNGVLPSSFASILSLIWPLSLVGESRLVPLEMRKYAINQLRRIGQQHKIQQATRTADSIAKAEKNDIW